VLGLTPSNRRVIGLTPSVRRVLGLTPSNRRVIGLTPSNKITQNSARADGGELVWVPKKDKFGLGRERFEQGSEHRLIDHRRLVDDHEVRFERRGTVMKKAVANGVPSEQAVERRWRRNCREYLTKWSRM
jgi:hypothetical protein